MFFFWRVERDDLERKSLVYLQVVVGNLHLVSSVAALLSYYSRRPWAMVLTGNLVSLLSVTSITLGGLLTGKHGNCYVGQPSFNSKV